ncbi:MAG: CHAT domain-containing protein [Gemmatimonadaceae bacterium]
MNDKQINQLLHVAKSQLTARGYTVKPDALERIRLWLSKLNATTVDQYNKSLQSLLGALPEPSKSSKVLTTAAVNVAIVTLAVKNTTTRPTKFAKSLAPVAGTRSPGPGAGRKSAMGRSPFGMAPVPRMAPSAPPSVAAPPPPPPPPPPPAPRPTQRAKPPQSPGASESAPPATRKEPPRSAYALVDAPDSVVSGDEFDVVVGLSEVQGSNVIGAALALPANTSYPYVLSLQLVAEGFDAVNGGAWRQDVTATEDDPYPRTNFHLKAQSQTKGVQPRALQVVYSIAGQTIGFAVRPIAVLAKDSRAKVAEAETSVAAIDVSVPTEEFAPDLTIHIIRDANTRTRLLWTIESPHATVSQLSADAKAESTDIGDAPDQFAKTLVQQVNLKEGKLGLYAQMKGVGNQVANKIPKSVWKAIHAAAVAASGPPSILILSEEPYVPWELATFSAPLAVDGAPAFLGAQTNVGRWILGQSETQLPPPHQLGVTSMAVIWGQYSSSKWARLTSAEEEAAVLQSTYNAQSIDAKIEPVLKCLEGDPPATALHFAIHGSYNPGGIQDGLVLTDDETINPTQVSGSTLSAKPFVFLNACQVGSAQEVLGDYAGMASAFLQAQASAVIAPLWSIKDGIAKEISMEFYQDAFAGEPVAAVMRKQRAKYGSDNSATYLAYQYFGHPQLQLTRKKTS